MTLVPEGLVLLTSLTFAVAAMRLARRGMLVQALNSVEVLANVDTVCLDKTGTLTDGRLVLERTVAATGRERADVERLLLSGDSPATVAAVADRAGIPAGPGPVAGSQELPDDPAALAALAEERTVFGRLTPEDKRRLVEALTASGRSVAMIGDGVNDVPAMKSSRLAIAFGAGSQLAKRASPTPCS